MVVQILGASGGEGFDPLLEALLSDIAERERAPIVRTVVTRENTRSLRLWARIGLTDERDDPDERFVQPVRRASQA